jgi:hypothetical protein
MAKTIALPDPAGRLAGLLAAKGYRLVSLQEAGRFRAHVDAVLYGGRRPDADNLTAATNDMALGGPADDELPGAIMLNISGLNPEAAVAELEYRLRHRGWRW